MNLWPEDRITRDRSVASEVAAIVFSARHRTRRALPTRQRAGTLHYADQTQGAGAGAYQLIDLADGETTYVGHAGLVLAVNAGETGWEFIPIPTSTGPMLINASTGDAVALVGAIDGANRAFTVSHGSYLTGTLKVWLNGQLQIRGATFDWREINPAAGTFQMAVAPDNATNDWLMVEYQY